MCKMNEKEYKKYLTKLMETYANKRIQETFEFIEQPLKEYYNESHAEFFTKKTAKLYREYSKEIESKDYDTIINFLNYLIKKSKEGLK